MSTALPDDLVAEYRAARESAVWADFSDRTKLEVRGRDRARFLHNFCTNDIKRLKPGQGCEAFVTTAQGKIVAHLRVYCEPESLWLDTVPAMAEPLIRHFDRYIIADQVELLDRTASLHQWIVTGPRAADLLAATAAGTPLPNGDLVHAEVQLAGVPSRVRGSSLLGDGGFDILCDAGSSLAVRTAFERSGLRAIGAETMAVLRIEAGTPQAGVDIDDTNLPQEVGRDRQAISFTKGCYLGQETVARIDAHGHVNRRLVGLVFPSCQAMAPRGSVLLAAGKEVGNVTSCAISPGLGSTIGLGYVRRGHEAPETPLECLVGGRTVAAVVAALPLVSGGR
jgi:hypothetical protein